VIRRRGQAVAGIGSNVLKAINKRQSRWGHRRRRSGPHPNIDSPIRHKGLSALVQGAQFGSDSFLMKFARRLWFSNGESAPCGPAFKSHR
jgi:hypothetical protein